MRDLRLALAQIDTGLGTVTANLEQHERTIAEAVQGRAELVVFPELSLTGYVLRDQVPEVASTLESETLRAMCEMSREIDIVVGFVEESPEHLFYNAAAYLSGGQVRHVHRKVYLPTYGMFEEGRDFASGGRLRSFECAAGRAGLLICEDAWHPSSAFLLTQQQAQLLIVPSSGPSRGAKPDRGLTSVEVWRSLLTVTAQFQTSWIIYVNRVGCEDGLIFGGGSMVIDPFGRVTAEAPALEESLLFVDLESEVLRRARTVYPLIRDADLELVYRESERIRAERHNLPLPDES
jgi:predicted amidohydrolase